MDLKEVIIVNNEVNTKYKIKEEALETVRECGFELEFVSNELKADEDVVLEAVKQVYGAVYGVY